MINFFISSTFSDMHQERDVFQKNIQAKVNYYANKYGEKVLFSDLRWGINTAGMTEKESGEKIITNCVTEIQKCVPYMIVLLGDRYGTIIDDWITEPYIKGHDLEFDKGISVTALEILAGDKYIGLDNILFYFREIEGDYPEEFKEKDPGAQEKLRLLKEKISNSGAKIKNYRVSWNENTGQFDGMNSLIDLVSTDIEAIIKTQMKDPDRLLVENISADSYVSDETFSTIQDFLERNRIVVLSGEELSGKTSLAATLVMKFENTDGYRPVPLFFRNPVVNGISDEDIITIVKRKLDSVDVRQEEKVVIILDGIDDITPPNTERRIIEGIIDILKAYPADFSYILTSSVHVNPDRVLSIDIQNELNEDSIDAIEHLLLPGKEISEDIKDLVKNKCIGKSFLYEKLLIRRLDMMTKGDFSRASEYEKELNIRPIDAIERVQKNIIEALPDDLYGLTYKFVLDYAGMFDNDKMQTALWLIANSLDGFDPDTVVKILSAEDIREELLVFFVSCCRDVLNIYPNGKIDFATSELKSYFQVKLDDYTGEIEKEYLPEVLKVITDDPDYNGSERLFWHLKGHFIADKDTLEQFLNLDTNTCAKIFKLLDEQNHIDGVTSEEEVTANSTWAYSLTILMDKYSMDSRTINTFLDKICQLMEEKSVFRYVNCVTVLQTICSIIEIKIKDQKEVEESFGFGYKNRWISLMSKTILIMLEAYEYLGIDKDNLEKELGKYKEEAYSHYNDRPETLINKGIELVNMISAPGAVIGESEYIELTKVSDDIYQRIEEISINPASDAVRAAAHVINTTGDVATSSGRFEDALNYYAKTFEFYKRILKSGDDSWLLILDIGFLYYKISLCMQKLDHGKSCVRNNFLNAKRWLELAYEQCDDNSYAEAIVTILGQISEYLGE
ncbi:MAG: DUF4062 domain-containing protein [Butyrivibrio sp.]|nr:DUF4062 domain-containing protein [Butyrivibrio sp.]